MVMDHVEFGPLAKEVPLLLLLGPPSFAWKNMTCFLKHWNCMHVHVGANRDSDRSTVGCSAKKHEIPH